MPGSLTIRPETPDDAEAIRAVALRPGALHSVNGVVRYPAAFDGV